MAIGSEWDMASIGSQIIARNHLGTANYEVASNSANLGEIGMTHYTRQIMRQLRYSGQVSYRVLPNLGTGIESPVSDLSVL